MRCISLICLLFLPCHAFAQEGEEGVEGDVEGGVEGGEADEPDTLSDGPANALGEYSARVERAEGSPFKVLKGETLEDVVREIGKNPAGHTLCKPAFKLDWVGKPKKVGGCTITVTCTVRLPQWANRDKRPESAQVEWDRFRQAVDAHEQGHIEAVRPIYEGLCNAVKDKSKAEVRKAFNNATANADAAERAHDDKTDHGRKTGSQLDGSKDPRQSPRKANTLGMEGEGAEAPVEAPAEEAPAQEAPAEEAPAQEAPAEEAPAQEAPADE